MLIARRILTYWVNVSTSTFPNSLSPFTRNLLRHSLQLDPFMSFLFLYSSITFGASIRQTIIVLHEHYRVIPRVTATCQLQLDFRKKNVFQLYVLEYNRAAAPKSSSTPVSGSRSGSSQYEEKLDQMCNRFACSSKEKANLEG